MNVVNFSRIIFLSIKLHYKQWKASVYSSAEVEGDGCVLIFLMKAGECGHQDTSKTGQSKCITGACVLRARPHRVALGHVGIRRKGIHGCKQCIIQYFYISKFKKSLFPIIMCNEHKFIHIHINSTYKWLSFRFRRYKIKRIKYENNTSK